jgi:membrane protein YqaA with SNARE-associated domain
MSKANEKCLYWMKRIGVGSAVFFGLMMLGTWLFLVVAFASPNILPDGSNLVLITAALPFMLYPFWWMAVSAIAGGTAVYTYMRWKR